MTNKNIFTLYSSLISPIVGLLLIFMTILFFQDNNYIMFSLFYVWIYLWMLLTPSYTLPVVAFFCGIIIDSLYDISIGTFSLILSISMLLIHLQSKYIKNNDFLKSSGFFCMNTIIMLLLVRITGWILPINFPSLVLFFIKSSIMFFILFPIIRIYLNLFDNNYE